MIKFEETGLPDKPSFREAFSFACAHFYEQKKSEQTNLERTFRENYAEDLKDLETDRANGILGDLEFEQQKTAITSIAQNALANAENTVNKHLDEQLLDESVFPALLLSKNSERKSESAALAALLSSATQTHIDYKKTAAKFGEGIADIAAEVAHAFAHPEQTLQIIPEMTDEAKSILLTKQIAYLDHKTNMCSAYIQAQSSLKRQFQNLLLEDDEDARKNIALLWGVDKALDAMCLLAYNRFSQTLDHPVRLDMKEGKLITHHNQTGPADVF